MGAMAKKLKCAPGPVEEESKFQQLGEFKNELLRLLAENLGIEYWDNVLLVCKRWRIVFSPCAESFNIVTNPRASVSLIETFQFNNETFVLVATGAGDVHLYLLGKTSPLCKLDVRNDFFVSALKVISQNEDGFAVAVTTARHGIDPFYTIWVGTQNNIWRMQRLKLTKGDGVTVDYMEKSMYDVLPLYDGIFLVRLQSNVCMMHMKINDKEAHIIRYTSLAGYNYRATGFIHTYSTPPVFGVLRNVSIVGSHEHPYDLYKWDGKEYIKLKLPTLCDDNERRDVFERTHTQITAYKDVLLSGVNTAQRWDVNTHIPPRSNGFSTYPSHLRVYAILHGRLYCVDNGPSTAVGTKCSFLRKVNDDGWFESVYEKVVVLCKPKTGNAYCVRVLTCT